ncbi:MAG: hypothetical protein F7C35_01950, partial [Desulfurococcales archaeon]|nr:hypothetical protein [Desulfurococcales archaeon]
VNILFIRISGGGCGGNCLADYFRKIASYMVGYISGVQQSQKIDIKDYYRYIIFLFMLELRSEYEYTTYLIELKSRCRYLRGCRGDLYGRAYRPVILLTTVYPVLEIVRENLKVCGVIPDPVMYTLAYEVGSIVLFYNEASDYLEGPSNIVEAGHGSVEGRNYWVEQYLAKLTILVFTVIEAVILRFSRMMSLTDAERLHIIVYMLIDHVITASERVSCSHICEAFCFFVEDSDTSCGKEARPVSMVGRDMLTLLHALKKSVLIPIKCECECENRSFGR